MNKMCKKGIALLMAACYLVLLMTTGFVSVAAAEDPTGVLSDSMILDLRAFDILEGMEDGQLHLDQEITRAEMAKVVATEMQLTDVHFPENYGTIYDDVDSTHWAFTYITMLSSIGLLNGDPDGNFYPDNTVTYAEATKILVCMLGFSSEAEENGGYPLGYMATGARLGLTQGITAETDEGLNRASAMRMIYNSLDADRLVPAYGTQQAYLSSQTYRDLLMGEEDDGLVEIEGVVTANYASYILDPVYEMEDWQVQVDGQLYDKGDTNIDEYLGMKVKMYVQVHSTFQYGVVKNFELSSDNQVEEVDVQDIGTFTSTGIEYTPTDANRSTNKTFSSTVEFLYNGRPISATDLDALNISEMDDGTITLISNQQGSSINVVLINEYESFSVDRVVADNMRIYLANEKTYQNARYLNLDEDRYGVTVVLKDAEGNDITLEDIKEGDIITIYGSRDGSLLKIYACDNSVTGTIRTIVGDQRTIEIDGTTYEVEKNVDLDSMVGRTVIAKLNYLGKVAELEEELGTSGNYAAIVNMALDSTFGDTLKLHLVIPGLIQDDVEEADDSDPTQQDIPMIAAQNEDLIDLEVASKASFNGTSYGAAELKAAIETQMAQDGTYYLPISYSTDSNGYVRRIETLERAPQMPLSYDANGNIRTILAGDKTYNAYEKTFGLSGGAFGLDDSTRALCIPSNTISSDNDYLARIEMNNAETYYVVAYEYNESTRCPDVVVFYEDMQYSSIGNITSSSDIGLVADNIVTLDDEGNQVNGISLMTEDGTLVEAVVSEDTNSTADFSLLKPGDLIYYSLDAKDQLDGYELIQSLDPVPSDMHDNTLEKEIYVGEITNVDYRVVSNTLNKWVDTLTIEGTGIDTAQYEVERTSPPPIYIYDAKNQTVEVGTSDDFLMDHEKAVVFSVNNVVKAVAMVE